MFEGGDSNLYGYVVNDPVNFVDPKGKQKIMEDIIKAKNFDPFINIGQATKGCVKNIDVSDGAYPTSLEEWDKRATSGKGGAQIPAGPIIEGLEGPVECVIGAFNEIIKPPRLPKKWTDKGGELLYNAWPAIWD